MWAPSVWVHHRHLISDCIWSMLLFLEQEGRSCPGEQIKGLCSIWSTSLLPLAIAPGTSGTSGLAPVCCVLPKASWHVEQDLDRNSLWAGPWGNAYSSHFSEVLYLYIFTFYAQWTKASGNLQLSNLIKEEFTFWYFPVLVSCWEFINLTSKLRAGAESGSVSLAGTSSQQWQHNQQIRSEISFLILVTINCHTEAWDVTNHTLTCINACLITGCKMSLPLFNISSCCAWLQPAVLNNCSAFCHLVAINVPALSL